MISVALTGGIGSGKSAVAARLSQKGVPVLDADQVTRELVIPGQVAFHEILDHFGPSVLEKDGTLDRSALREIIFRDPSCRRILEAILHPRVLSHMQDWLACQGNAPYAVLVIPLLLETGQTKQTNRILVVDSDPDAQIARVVQRDGQTRDQVLAILNAQADPSARRAVATEIIENNGSLDDLYRLTDQMHQYYLSITHQ